MAWPGTLTAEEQVVVKVFTDQLLRPDVLRLVQALNITVGIKEEWDLRIQAMFTKLAAGDVIPNESNLAGAQALTKSDVQGLLTSLAAFLTSANTVPNRTAFNKALGGVNMIRE